MADGGEVIFKFKGDDSALKKTLGDVGKLATTALKGIAVGTAAVAAGFAGIVTASVKARGEMEQLAGGAKKIFDEMDFSQIEEDASKAYKEMNLSAKEYLEMINSVGATFSQTMGDKKGYETAKLGLQAIADYASGTGADIGNLNDKFRAITRSTSSYLSIADQFAGILPQTTKDFLSQAQAAGFLSEKYKKLTDVPIAEYQEAVSKMVQKGVGDMNLLGNTAAEAETTLTGSLAAMRASWENFLSGTGDLGQVVDSASVALDNIVRILDEIFPQLSEQIDKHMPQILELVSKVLDIISAAVEKYAPQIAEISFQIMKISAEAILKGLPTILLAISDLISQLELALADASTKFADVAFTWLANLATGIMRGIGNALLAISDLISQLELALADASTKFAEAAFGWMANLSTGIMQGIGKVLLAISNLIGQTFMAIVNFNDQIWQAGADWIIQLIDGIKSMYERVQKVIDNIKTIIKAILTRLKDEAKQWGIDMLTGFANGIMERLGHLKAKVEEVANSIRSKLHFSRPDEGPLRDYETWMPDMVQGLVNSLDKAMPMLTDKMNELAFNMSPSLNGNVNSIGPSVNVVVNSSYEQDPLGQMVSQIKTFSNGAKNDYNYGYGG